MRDGDFAAWCSVFFATRVSLSARKGLPVFGFASKRGEFDDDTATRMRCPLLNTSDVLHRLPVETLFELANRERGNGLTESG
jgi:hypothetical protein